MRMALAGLLLIPDQEGHRKVRPMNDDDETIETLEIDLEIADIIEILETNGIDPEPQLVMALWDWKETRCYE